MTGLSARLISLVKRRARRWLQVGVQCTVVFVLVLIVVQTAEPPPKDYYRHQLSAQTGDLSFNFLAWEFTAVLGKLGYEFAAPQDTLPPAGMSATVASRSRCRLSDWSRRAGQTRAGRSADDRP